MRKIREWPPWVKVVLGGTGFAIGMTSVILRVRASEATREASVNPLGSLIFMAGLILLVWGGFEAISKHPRILGFLVLAAGLILTPVTVLSLPALWEWSKGGMVSFIPAPFLVPLVLVIPGFLIFYGIAAIREK